MSVESGGHIRSLLTSRNGVFSKQKTSQNAKAQLVDVHAPIRATPLHHHLAVLQHGRGVVRRKATRHTNDILEDELSPNSKLELAVTFDLPGDVVERDFLPFGEAVDLPKAQLSLVVLIDVRPKVDYTILDLLRLVSEKAHVNTLNGTKNCHIKLRDVLSKIEASYNNTL